MPSAFQQGNINIHASLHEEGGSDEIDITQLAGYVAPPSASDSTPEADSGEGDSGESDDYSRADHVHPAASGGGNPTGTLIIWPTDTAPTGYLLCYGQAVSRTTYSALYAVIGTVFGVGDNSTTFNLPDLRGRVPLGQDDMGGSSANVVTDAAADSIGGVDGHETHTLSVAELASHSHGETLHYGKATWASAGSDSGYAPTSITATTDKKQLYTDNTGSGTAHNNMQPYITVNYAIKT